MRPAAFLNQKASTKSERRRKHTCPRRASSCSLAVSFSEKERPRRARNVSAAAVGTQPTWWVIFHVNEHAVCASINAAGRGYAQVGGERQRVEFQFSQIKPSQHVEGWSTNQVEFLLVSIKTAATPVFSYTPARASTHYASSLPPYRHLVPRFQRWGNLIQ